MNFTDWKNYFKKNIDHFDHIDWKTVSQELSPDEIKLIKTSIQQFQKGENSEGKNLINYAKKSDLLDYHATIVDFIREEQRHAIVLGKFMQANHIEKIKDHWVDSVFRNIRKLSNLENSIIVLITAEIIAAIYYKGLRDATQSPTLKKICQQILVDEEMHINFQSFTLLGCRNQNSKIKNILNRIYHRILMRGTIIVVWIFHGNIMKAANYSFSSYYKEVIAEFNRAEKMMTGKMKIELIHQKRKSSTLTQ